ncbi:MAG: YifB family Mg chelatase-like AAA ATPase [Dethiobacteria bacterium]
MIVKIISYAVLGIDGFPVEVEVDISGGGLPVFDLIGLPDPSVREAKERVRSAIRNSGFEFPLSRITVNLAPADLKKEGPGFDLAIAIGLLLATKQIPYGEIIRRSVMVGELSLDGTLRGIPGALAIASSLSNHNRKQTELFVPHVNAAEASLIKGINVRGVTTLEELISFLSGKKDIPITVPDLENLGCTSISTMGMEEVKGQENAKRALEIAAAGSHNVIFYGPPGTGKTMLARRLPTILPEPSLEEMLEITRIHSVAGKLSADMPLVKSRPFRSPHHSSSAAGIIGGGKIPRPGEVSLAHRGVLFLDELPEFSREVLESLRQPLEDREVTITRTAATLKFPADFIFTSSMNPCPCGNYGDPRHACRCSHHQIQRYRSRLSGPLLDRIDIQIEVPRLDYSVIETTVAPESTGAIRARVKKARMIQTERFKKLKIITNSEMGPRQVKNFCPLGNEARALAKQAFNRLGLSMRAYDRILKVSRTIADLEGCENIEAQHLAEAIQYRNLDRELFRE